MKRYRINPALLLMAAALFTFSSCSSENHEDILSNWIWDDGTVDPDPEPDPEPTEANPKVVAAGWENVTTEFDGLPEYINVYKKSKTSENDPAVAYIAVADMAQAKFDVSSDLYKNADGNFVSDALYTPSEFYEKAEKPAIVINGGLFYDVGNGYMYSQSALYRGGEMLSSNFNYWSTDWVNFWYPTLAFFYQDQNGEFHTKWSYYSWTTQDFGFETPRKCDPNAPETASPTDGDPGAAIVLNDGKTVQTGIGGVGMLVHDGILQNTWGYEMLDVSGGSNQPRTAIGYAKEENRLVFFVCEGRNPTEGVAGMTIDEVGIQMSAIGCTEAICLDGGGSSCMLVNGKETIKGSDGAQRKVIDACYIR